MPVRHSPGTAAVWRGQCASKYLGGSEGKYLFVFAFVFNITSHPPPWLVMGAFHLGITLGVYPVWVCSGASRLRVLVRSSIAPAHSTRRVSTSICAVFRLQRRGAPVSARSDGALLNITSRAGPIKLNRQGGRGRWKWASGVSGRCGTSGRCRRCRRQCETAEDCARSGSGLMARKGFGAEATAGSLTSVWV